MTRFRQSKVECIERVTFAHNKARSVRKKNDYKIKPIT
jgi:hypothetical protein